MVIDITGKFKCSERKRQRNHISKCKCSMISRTLKGRMKIVTAGADLGIEARYDFLRKPVWSWERQPQSSSAQFSHSV